MQPSARHCVSGFFFIVIPPAARKEYHSLAHPGRPDVYVARRASQRSDTPLNKGAKAWAASSEFVREPDLSCWIGDPDPKAHASSLRKSPHVVNWAVVARSRLFSFRVGVMVTFCIEAWLVAGFLAAKVAKYAGGGNRQLPDWLNTTYRKLTDAFQVVLPAIFWSSVLLSLGIVAASILIAAAASGDGQEEPLKQWRAGEDYTVYDSQLSALALLFSIQATFMDQLDAPRKGQTTASVESGRYSCPGPLGDATVGLARLDGLITGRKEEFVFESNEWTGERVAGFRR
ncbi:hypothetical protein CSAL01_00833 [Colletotrichum salicis]|uniref:Uncharacterized protein n=1 Tax=Colletotrichum salicis TaxID=1209931 RepID=A0A135V4D3_9PEZI|nr:hypothetical protein CSAL01_00833 [Colletotrichum salicis]